MASPINFLLLIELIVVVIVASAFLFYWNRLLGSLVAFFVRLYTWRSFSAYISIGSLQISPLAGRISFRDVEYHSSNISVRALHGHITWRYWIFRVRQEADSQSTNLKRNRLPCRIIVYAEGVECFVYNRTPAYDAIVKRMKKHEKDEASNASMESLAKQKSNMTTGTDGSGLGFGARLRKVVKSTISESGHHQDSSSTAGSTQKPTLADPHAIPTQPKPVKTPSLPGVNWLREALPVELHVVSGSAVLGSDSTPSVIVANFGRTDGTLEITDSRSACDEYKFLVNLNFEQTKVLFRTNVDYSGPILAHGKKVYDELYKMEQDLTKQPPSLLSSFLGFHALSKRFAFIRNPKFSSPPVAGLPADRVWRGLARYRMADGDQPEQPRREEREYAKVTELVDATSVGLTYYADTPGLVPLPSEADIIDETDEFGNVEPPPEYGIDIVIRSGRVNYGPWSDRQRDAIQKTFAPSIFFDSEPKPRLQPGDTRMHANMNVNVQFVDKTSLRMPTREPSKDYRFENEAKDEERRYGWIDVVVGENSSVNYTQSQYATSRGYDAILILHLDALVVSSSVNYAAFLTAPSCKLSLTMPTPLSWKARRDWGLDLTLDSPEVSLLRDHVQLISDLAKDWSTGAVGDFHHFVPNHYNFRVTLINYDFKLFLNDFNVIDDPHEPESNVFLQIKGPRVDAHVAVDTTLYRPELSTIPFAVSLHDAIVNLKLPAWDTHRSFSQSESDYVEVGKIGDVSANGLYTFYSMPRPDHQETLKLHLEGKRVAFKAFGWALRRLFSTKDNYFGGYTNFQLIEDFFDKIDLKKVSTGDDVEAKYRPGRSDPFAVQVTMNIEESLILLSEQIYGCQRGLAMPVPQLQMALKSAEHFMELSLDALPTYIVATTDLNHTYRLGVAPPVVAKEAVFVEGLELKANRLFGPQPWATTYLCLWEFAAPRITAFMTPEFLNLVQSSVSAVAFDFVDVENAPTEFYIPKTPPDVTFFKLGIEEIAVTLFVDDLAVSVNMPAGVNLDTSSLATRSFASAVGVSIPDIQVSMLGRASHSHKWSSLGTLKTGVALDVFSAPSGWQEKADAQQRFLMEEDAPTKRIWYMYQAAGDEADGNHLHNVYIPRPRPKEPVIDDTESEASSYTSAEDGNIRANRASSASSSDSGLEEIYEERIPRRSRLRTTVRDLPPCSEGDESDTASEVSDSTYRTVDRDTDYGGHDMASAMAQRLRALKSVQRVSLPSFPEWKDELDTESESPEPEPSSLAEGTIVKLSLKEVGVHFGSKTLESGAIFAAAISTISISPEVQLDQMLAEHVDKAQASIAPKDPTLIVVDVQTVRLQMDVSAPSLSPVKIDAVLRGISSSVFLTPPRQESAKTLDVVLATNAMALAISPDRLKSGQTSLADIEDDNVLRVGGSSVLQIRSAGLQIGLHLASEQHIRLKAVDIGIHAVTTAAAVFIALARSLEETVGRIAAARTNSPITLPRSALISSIIESAHMAGITNSHPQFVFERPYSLHVKDQRSIRQDPGWLMLCRLRLWLRRCDLVLSPPGKPAVETAMYIVSEMARLEDAFCSDENLVVAQPFVHEALSAAGALPEVDEGNSSKNTNVFINLGTIVLQHYGQMLETTAIAKSSFRLGSTTVGLQKSHAWVDEQPIEHMRVLLAIKETSAELKDSLLPAIETLLTLGNDANRTPTPTPASSDGIAYQTMIVIIDVQVQDAEISILAGGLRLRLNTRHFHTAFARRQNGNDKGAAQRLTFHDAVTVSCEAVELALLQPQDDLNLITNSADRIVTCLRVRGIRSSIDSRCLGVKDAPVAVKVAFGLQSVDYESRPQLRAFLAFARDWQKRHLSQYRPMINDIRALVAQQKSGAPEVKPELSVELDLSIGEIHLSVRAAKAVWIRWDVGKIYVTRYQSGLDVEFGIRLAPQIVGAFTSMKKTKEKDASSIKLPSLTAIGSYRKVDNRPHISATITLGFFVGVLKPAVLDRLLSLHQRLGKDIMHIVQEYREAVRKELSTRHAKYTSTTSRETETSQTPKPAGLPVLMDIHVSVAGVRVGLRADDVATTLLFEALALRGQVTNTTTDHAALLWRAKVDHFGLSLGHLLSSDISDYAEPIRKHRSAYMVLDIDVQETPSDANVASQLSVSLNRVHTVMHVAALSELSDLVRSWQSDIHVLRDNRASEVAEMKTTTSRIMKRLDASDKPVSPEDSWFASRLFTVHVVGIGLAIPLDEAAAIDLSQRDNVSVPALLFSIRVISFQNKRNETARFKVRQMALQFLDKFDQGASEHFTGDYHPSTNRMLLPSLEAEAQMSSIPEMWSLSAHLSATDFKLSLAPDVTEGIFKLLDLYESGKERVAELQRQYTAEMANRETVDSVHAKYEDNLTPSPARLRQRIMVRMSYTFNSGKVELHRSPDSPSYHKGQTPRGRQAWHDTFVLPTVSLWMDYAGPRPRDNNDVDAAGVLLFNSAVHESRNTLRPTILPFLVELVNRIERRQRSQPRRPSFSEAEKKAEQVAASVSESTLYAIAPTPGSTIRLEITLRIDRSNLRLSCAPDSNAYVDLKWESGGFMASTSLGGDESSTVAGSISGVTASLSHEFAEQGRSCIEAGAKDLAFSVTHCSDIGRLEQGLSVVLDTQLAGQFRLDAFSAWLIFTSVWIDNAPKLDIPLRTAIPEAASSDNVNPTPAPAMCDTRGSQQKLAVAALVRFRTIDFDAEVAVSQVKLEITPVVLRTISNGEKTEVELKIGTTKVTAQGDISGNLCSDRLVFNTIRRSSRASEESESTVLSMSIDAGDLRGNLLLGGTNIFRFHLEPALVSLADDWANFDQDSDSRVSLAFSVKAGQLRVVLRLLAIPRLLGNLYSVLDMVDSQKRIAVQRSETFKSHQQRKTDDASPVAAVLLQTARRASATSTGGAHIRTAQTMRFDLAGVDLGVFNEDYEAGGHSADFYRFVVGKVEADLKRQSTKEDIPTRDLGLLISLVQWDTSDGAKVAAKEMADMTPKELIEMAWKQGHKSVASLPSMTMNMSSRELSRPSVLDFDFDLVWGETDGDIGILPNFFEQALTAFRKMLKGLDEQELARARRTDPLLSPIPAKNRRKESEDEAKPESSLEYRPRDPTWADDPPIPKLRQLGESTGEAARFIPRIKSATKELPLLSHRFVTLPLEEGMDLLLKLYEKQLPELSV